MEALLNEAIAHAVWITPIVTIIVQLLKPFNINKQFYPHVSILVGVLIGVIIGFASGSWVHLLTGLLSGLSASGLYDVGKLTKQAIKNKPKG